jgi:hypothetical protein
MLCGHRTDEAGADGMNRAPPEHGREKRLPETPHPDPLCLGYFIYYIFIAWASVNVLGLYLAQPEPSAYDFDLRIIYRIASNLLCGRWTRLSRSPIDTTDRLPVV